MSPRGRNGLDEMMTSVDMLGVGEESPRRRYLAELAILDASRPCTVFGCGHVGLPCPDHGQPAEDRGEWLWERRAS